jgi:hypothetical protein
MEATVNEALACLQGQRIKGPLGNNGISKWEGKIHFFYPQIEVENIEVEMSWNLSGGSDSWDDFLRIYILASK